MRRPLSVHKVITRGWMVVASLTVTGAMLTMGGSTAAAFPQPTVAEVQHELSVLNNKVSALGQQYDEVLQQLSLANQRLTLLNKETKRYRATFGAMRAQIDRIAAVAYEQGAVDSPLSLLTSSTPQQVLDQSSILGELSAVDSAQIRMYLNASHQLLTAQQAAARTRAGILRLKHSLGKRLAKLKKLQGQEETLLVDLTPVQKVKVAPGGGTGSKPPPPPPVSGAAGRAVKFAFAQIGCPYVFGATGPCNSGFDCSGLMQSSWQYAGVSIPRVSYDQMADLPPVSLHTASGAFTTANLEPGDILGFAGNSHVGMYVGGNELIDAPTPGQDVEEVPLSGWYLQELDGAVRP
ncbi:MAG TPA: C40 family peptidase [Streptosporangiaceae bacterium]|nr:C40 family peptidase [Streptosporangiaceae bacterium]